MISFPNTPVSHDGLIDKYYLETPDFKSFLKTSSVPVLINELSSVLGQYVLAFEKGDQGFTPVVLTDVGFNRNLYVSRDGRWLCRYLPACLQTYPFTLQKTDTGETVLGVADDRLVPEGQDGALALFNAEGELSKSVQKYQTNLETLEKAYQSTLDRTRILSDEGLIVDWPLRVRLQKNEDPVPIDGLYRIDPAKIVALTGSKLEHLKNHGVLTFALSQPMSMQHVSILMNRVAYLMRQETPPKTTTGAVPKKPSFDLSDDDMIDFSL